jgi:hypothetical protein
MPRLTAAELQEARLASGRLGGRPRKPTVSEAREAALSELVPLAVVSLKTHIDSGAPDAWKASVRVLELAFARPEIEEPTRPTSAAEIASMGWRELTLLAAQLTDVSEMKALPVVTSSSRSAP